MRVHELRPTPKSLYLVVMMRMPMLILINTLPRFKGLPLTPSKDPLSPESRRGFFDPVSSRDTSHFTKSSRNFLLDPSTSPAPLPTPSLPKCKATIAQHLPGCLARPPPHVARVSEPRDRLLFTHTDLRSPYVPE